MTISVNGNVVMGGALRAAVRQLSIALITFSWSRLTWPRLASRQAGPWSRKIAARADAAATEAETAIFPARRTITIDWATGEIALFEDNVILTRFSDRS
jgi:hypothetical protein